MTNADNKIYLSPPHMCGQEIELLKNTFESNWIAPVGPNITAFEMSICRYVGTPYAVALVSGTAAIHLALQLCGVGPEDDVFCSTFTFAGSAFPIMYMQATPVFIDSESHSWNMDPGLLRKAIRERSAIGRRPGAVIAVHLYGQSVDIFAIKSVCAEFGIPLIEDAAESLGAFCGNVHTGTLGDFGILSFNGNKIITTSGGGMLIGRNGEAINRARYLSTQARDQFSWYEHSEVGYNYRMSNIVAAIGRAQLEVIEERVERRRQIYDYYRTLLADINVISLVPRDVYGRGNCWLTCILIDSERCNIAPETIRLALEQQNIESRPLWKPMHLQPVFKHCPAVVNGISERLFNCGLCLPSGTAMTDNDVERIAAIIKSNLSIR